MIYFDYMIILILVFVRMTALFILTPIFNNKNVPVIAKIGFIFFLSYIIMPIVIINNNLVIENFFDLGKFMVIEFSNGVAFGFVVSISISFIYIAGLLVDRNIGFAMVSVISPQDESQIPVSANLYFLFLMLAFFTLDFHLKLIEAIVKTYEILPLGTSIINYRLVYFYTEIMTQAFIVGVQIAAPFILTILVANIILGLLSKAMPGMNVFLIGMPLKVFVGLVTFLIIIQYYFDAFNMQLLRMIEYIYKLMGT
ncbi:flagellar biosynthetic protein FliR [Clostridiaceae bacterium HSG29]|nr:flagellar biosynthetic protein FliR [Clostridiaceae bacterium HSG29]